MIEGQSDHVLVSGTTDHGSRIRYHESRSIKGNDETLHGIDSLIPCIDPSASDLALLISGDPESSQSKELHLKS